MTLVAIFHYFKQSNLMRIQILSFLPVIGAYGQSPIKSHNLMQLVHFDTIILAQSHHAFSSRLSRSFHSVPVIFKPTHERVKVNPQRVLGSVFVKVASIKRVSYAIQDGHLLFLFKVIFSFLPTINTSI